jgi:DNA polymerase
MSLKDSIVACTNCDLRNTCTAPVPFSGVGKKPVVFIVGEAPGQEEDEKGIPFIGKSGKLLRSFLKDIPDFDKDYFHITNVVKCRPPGNRTPATEEVTACSPWLVQEIELMKPDAILGFGRTSMEFFARYGKVELPLRVNSATFQVAFGDSVLPFVSFYHPSYLLRMGSTELNSKLLTRLKSYFKDGRFADI